MPAFYKLYAVHHETDGQCKSNGAKGGHKMLVKLTPRSNRPWLSSDAKSEDREIRNPELLNGNGGKLVLGKLHVNYNSNYFCNIIIPTLGKKVANITLKRECKKRFFDFGNLIFLNSLADKPSDILRTHNLSRRPWSWV